MNLPGASVELPIVELTGAVERLPRWLKKIIPTGNGNHFTASLIEELGLETVCESAKCPNRMECWSQRTATFMIMGNTCTRPCGFCSVPKGKTAELELDEPDRVAEAALRLGLKHVVITSVTRDDLSDGGAEHFYRSVLAVRRQTGAAVEVLTPDFIGKPGAVERVVEAAPEVFNHNTETVPLGQYLRPTPEHLQVACYLPPEEFDELGRAARGMGFLQVASGPFVRSSYHAREMTQAV